MLEDLEKLLKDYENRDRIIVGGDVDENKAKLLIEEFKNSPDYVFTKGVVNRIRADTRLFSEIGCQILLDLDKINKDLKPKDKWLVECGYNFNSIYSSQFKKCDLDVLGVDFFWTYNFKKVDKDVHRGFQFCIKDKIVKNKIEVKEIQVAFMDYTAVGTDISYRVLKETQFTNEQLAIIIKWCIDSKNSYSRHELLHPSLQTFLTP